MIVEPARPMSTEVRSQSSENRQDFRSATDNPDKYTIQDPNQKP